MADNAQPELPWRCITALHVICDDVENKFFFFFFVSGSVANITEECAYTHT